MPGLVLCHGFPMGTSSTADPGGTFPQLADRLVADAPWVVLTLRFRGTGTSEGDFSLAGWLEDLRVAVDHLLKVPGVSAVWLAGFDAGGSLALCTAAQDERVRGVATLSALADFDDWSSDPEAFLDHARRIGVVRNPHFPPDLETWSRSLREFRPLVAVSKLVDRSLLVIHGSHDDVVPIEHARALVDASHTAGGQAELRIINSGGHYLRHDPRAIAVLLGWLDHQQP